MLSKDCPEKLVVIGAGLMRTGTSSLQIALEHLLKRPCYHMSRVALHLREPTIYQWLTIYHNNGKGIEETLKGYSATVDYPACAFYAELLKAHPNAKVILTVRDSKDWVASCRATMFSPEMLRAPTLGRKLVYLQARTFSLLDLHDVMFSRTLGINYADATDEELESAFQCWNARVRASVPPERLLIFDPANGWGPLCAFLKVEVPSVAFPHVNQRIDMQEVLQKQLRIAPKLNGNAIKMRADDAQVVSYRFGVAEAFLQYGNDFQAELTENQRSFYLLDDVVKECTYSF